MINFYLALKEVWSNINDLFKKVSGRSTVPAFSTPESAASYVMSNSLYTGDPFNGAGDFYTHPERLQYAMELGQKIGKEKAFAGLYIDCDDVASWAYAALSKIDNCEPKLISLVDLRIVGSHVICVYSLGGKFGAIDTNGHRYLPNLSPSTVCETWNKIYAAKKYNYVLAVDTEYPF